MSDYWDSKSKLAVAGLLIATALIYAFLGYVVWKGLIHQPSPENAPETILSDKYTIIQGNSLKAITPPVYIEPRVLGMLTNGIEINTALLLDRIITCESGWRNICNQKYGCLAGIGLAQITPNTGRYCEEKLGRKLDLFSPDDNLECAIWLLENEGWHRWGTAETVGIWGSWSCFGKY